MPNFESCNLGRAGLEALASGRMDLLARRLQAASPDGAPPDDARLKKVAQDFASVFYSLAFKEMQQTVDVPGDDDSLDGGGNDSPIKQGAQDFMSMFLPQAIAGDSGDPLTRYIYQSLKQQYGGAVDEKA